MRHATRWLAGMVVLGLLVTSALAQDGLPKPGVEQEKLCKLWEGEWECTLDMMGTQGTGTASCRRIMNGFFCEMTFKGELMGIKMEGRSVTGYCPTRKVYQSTWIDSLSPSIYVQTGKMTDEKTMVEEGEGPNMQGQMEKMKSVTVFKDEDTIEMTMYKVEDGKETKQMTIVYKRKK
jgi:hypothetical protein